MGVIDNNPQGTGGGSSTFAIGDNAPYGYGRMEQYPIGNVIENTHISEPSVCDVAEIYAGKKGAFQVGSGVREYVRVFRIHVNLSVENVRHITEAEILSDDRLPRPYGSYVSTLSGATADMLALVVHYELVREDPLDWSTWLCTVHYSTQMPAGGPPQAFAILNPSLDNSESFFNNPWWEPPEIEWDVYEATEASQMDLDGKPFLNSAMQPFSPAPTVPVAYPILTIIRNEQYFDAEYVRKWSYAVNKSPFMGALPECAEMAPPRAKVLWRGPLKYYRATYRIKFMLGEVTYTNAARDQYKSFQTALLDAGFYQRIPVTTYVLSVPTTTMVPVPIMRNGQRVSSQPALLDGNGRELMPDQYGQLVPVYKIFRTRQRQEFADIFNNLTP